MTQSFSYIYRRFYFIRAFVKSTVECQWLDARDCYLSRSKLFSACAENRFRPVYSKIIDSTQFVSLQFRLIWLSFFTVQFKDKCYCRIHSIINDEIAVHKILHCNPVDMLCEWKFPLERPFNQNLRNQHFKANGFLCNQKRCRLRFYSPKRQHRHIPSWKRGNHFSNIMWCCTSVQPFKRTKTMEQLDSLVDGRECNILTVCLCTNICSVEN